MTTQEKIIALDQIAAQINSFKGLDIAKAATMAVPGEGNPDAQVLFIGEAPGFHEDKTGRPFVGQAGKLLDKNLSAIGLVRSDVFITNVVKFRPPDNRDPFLEEIEACAGWLNKQISIIDPQIIVTLGRFSMAKFIPGVTISRVHGQPRFMDFGDKKVIIFPMYHPAAALRAGAVLKEFELDFNKLKDLLKTSIPSTPDPKVEQTSFL